MLNLIDNHYSHQFTLHTASRCLAVTASILRGCNGLHDYYVLQERSHKGLAQTIIGIQIIVSSAERLLQAILCIVSRSSNRSSDILA